MFSLLPQHRSPQLILDSLVLQLLQTLKLFGFPVIRVITKLPNTEQSSKGKGKAHKSTNRQNQSTTGKLGKLHFERTRWRLLKNTSCALYQISTFVSLSLGRCPCWWTFSPRGYHPPMQCVLRHWQGFITIPGSMPLLVDIQSPRVSSAHVVRASTLVGFYYYPWVDAPAGGHLVPEGIIRPCSACFDTGRVLLLSLGRCPCWWTFSPRGYHPPKQ